MKRIELTQNQFAIIDDEDFEKVSQYKWYAVKMNHKRGYYARRHFGKTIVSMHAFILDCPKGFQVDHKNGDGLDNRRANIRVCTHAENGRNRRPQISNRSSRYKGVTKVRNKNWVARIQINGKQINLGTFKTEEEAYSAYCLIAPKLHGEFFHTGDIPE